MITMGYALSKPKRLFKARNIIMWIVMFCMVFNSGVIPWYITMVNYRAIDTIWGLVLCGGLPVFNLLLGDELFPQPAAKPGGSSPGGRGQGHGESCSAL